MQRNLQLPIKFLINLQHIQRGVLNIHMNIHGFIHHTHKHQLSSFEGALTSPQQQQSRAECDASVASRRQRRAYQLFFCFLFLKHTKHSESEKRRGTSRGNNQNSPHTYTHSQA